MPTFKYQGRDITGKLVSGEKISPSPDMLSTQLFKENITPIHITLKNDKNTIWMSLKRVFERKKVSNNELGLFTRQMYTLLKAGVPIVSTVKQLAENSRSKTLSDALYLVMENLESGQSLSTAMQNDPAIFTPLIVGMVRVGENTGHLDEVFLHLTHYLELEGDTVKRAKSAVRYPLFVVSAILVGMFIMNIFVIPIFAKVYTRAHIPLPRMTVALINISNFFTEYWSFILVSLIVCMIAIARYLHNPKGQYQWHQFQLKIPVIGILLKRIILLRFAQTFAIVANSGVPILEGLGFVAQSIHNTYARQEIITMQNTIREGNSILQAAHTCKLLTPIEIQMLGVAEKTGELGAMLNEIAYYYQREVDYDLKKLTDMMEPILLIAISIMVLLLALAIYLPIWNMVKLVHQ